MKLITRDTDYAVRALCCIAYQKNRILAVRELARSLDVPRPFLRKLLQRLTQEGIVRSYKGWRGGFILACAPQRIRLVDVMKIFQGGIKINECLSQRKVCSKIACCPLHETLGQIERDVITRLKGLNIMSLAHAFAHAGFYGGK